MFWRYHSGWNYNGVTWNNCFKVRFNNVGYTAAGENIDSIVAFDRVMVWKWNETPAPTWFAPFEVTKDYGPLVGATTYSQNTMPVALRPQEGAESGAECGTDVVCGPCCMLFACCTVFVLF